MTSLTDLGMSPAEVERIFAKGRILLCQKSCPNGRPCFKGHEHEGRCVCINAWGMRYPFRIDWPTTCCLPRTSWERILMEDDYG